MQTERKGYLYAFFHILWIVLPFIAGYIAIRVNHLTDLLDKVDAFLVSFLWISVGLQGLLAGLAQIFRGEKSAAYLNWPYSPFVRELGYCNVAFGILGLLCLIVGGTWWAATGIGYSIFLLCAAGEHIYDMVKNHNYSLGNAGPTLWSDIIIPVAILILLYWHHSLLVQSSIIIAS